MVSNLFDESKNNYFGESIMSNSIDANKEELDNCDEKKVVKKLNYKI